MAKEMRTAKGRVTLMVSSTVYGIEELLEQVYALLTGFGYEVWASHMGTVTVYPTQTALESCMTAVQDCDLFLSKKFSGADDAKLFGTAQFSRYRQVEQFLREHFANKKLVKAKAGGAAS